jgi:hypothetical protein
MSNSISRNEFSRELADEGGYLNVKDMDPEVRAALHEAGVTDQQLAQIAGKDGEIAGAEFGALFDRLDAKDRDGNRATIALRDGSGQATAAGAALDELRAEVQRKRAAAGNDGIIHLGMRPQSQREAEALRSTTSGKQGGVHEIRAYDNGPVEVGGRSFDLSDPAQVRGFARSLGLKPADANRLEQALLNAPSAGRDELARLALALKDVGSGKLHASRLVLSGHGDGQFLVDDNETRLRHQSIRDVVALFPEGASKIRDLAFSSCFSGTNPREWAAWKQVFPNLDSLFGYAEFSPAADGGAPRDLRAWDRMSQGDHPEKVDPSRGATATWNRVDGDQNVPRLDAASCGQIADRADAVLARYPGRREGAALGDPQARRAYIEVSQALNADGLSDDLRTRLQRLKWDLFPITHPPER